MCRSPLSSKVYRSATLASALLVLALAVAPLSAQELSREQQAKLINDISQGLREIYVFPDVAAEMEELIQSKFGAGDYDELRSLAEFTVQLTEDLQSISHDLHLRVRPHVPLGEEGRRDPAEERRRQVEQARLTNYGFYRVERLSGNIGYLDLRNFRDAEIGGDTAVAAMNFLANSSALIIDLRQNGGGSPSMIQLISSYFFDERKHLNSFYIRRSDSYEEFWTHKKVKGPRMVDAPLYILTSGRTFSAAEEFTYNLKHMKRATIIGEITGGGAHPVDFLVYDLGDGLYASISMPFGRALNPITETNWEGTGVKPHIEVPAAAALERAHIEALTEVGARTTDPDLRFSLDWARQGLQARSIKIGLAEGDAAAFVGQYGPRRITLEDGQLTYQRDDGLRYELVPMGGDRFRLEGLDFFRIQFVRGADGKVTQLTGLYGDGRTDENMRSDG